MTEKWADTKAQRMGSQDAQSGYEAARIAELVRIRGAISRLMCERDIDMWQALECDVAELLGIEPGDEPFTWRWDLHVADDLEDDGMDGAL